MKSSKIILIVICTAGIGGLIYLYRKNKNASTSASATLNNNSAQNSLVTATNTEANITTEDPGSKIFDQMSQVLEADPVFKNKVFPADFYEAVKKDYENIKAGNPRTPEYNYGKPGAFMSVVDAWKDSMGISAETHQALWKLYSDYRGAISKASLNFNEWSL